MSAGVPIIAPFYADVDTTNAGTVSYGTSTVGGRNAFAVTWSGVGYFSEHAAPTDTFQLVMIERGDQPSGAFDFEFNYGSIGWDSGDLTGSNGVGGSAIAGYSDGAAMEYNVPGSGQSGAFLDGGKNSLSRTGRLTFQARGDEVTLAPSAPRSVPDGGSTLVALGLALGALRFFGGKFRGQR